MEKCKFESVTPFLEQRDEVSKNQVLKSVHATTKCVTNEYKWAWQTLSALRVRGTTEQLFSASARLQVRHTNQFHQTGFSGPKCIHTNEGKGGSYIPLPSAITTCDFQCKTLFFGGVSFLQHHEQAPTLHSIRFLRRCLLMNEDSDLQYLVVKLSIFLSLSFIDC